MKSLWQAKTWRNNILSAVKLSRLSIMHKYVCYFIYIIYMNIWMRWIIDNVSSSVILFLRVRMEVTFTSAFKCIPWTLKQTLHLWCPIPNIIVFHILHKYSFILNILQVKHNLLFEFISIYKPVGTKIYPN